MQFTVFDPKEFIRIRGTSSMPTDIEQYLNVRSAAGGSFSPDGELAFLLDTTGTPQVWSLSEPGAWPEQRTFFDERISFASFSPEREELIFGMDAGGNERTQLFRLENGTLTPLTDWEDRDGRRAKHRRGASRRNEPRDRKSVG